jgi:hypothetical protein
MQMVLLHPSPSVAVDLIVVRLLLVLTDRTIDAPGDPNLYAAAIAVLSIRLVDDACLEHSCG